MATKITPRLFTRLSATLTLALCAAGVRAQQLPLVELYRHNWALLNPAAFDREHFDDRNSEYFVSATYGVQWLNVEGAPRHYNVRAEYVPALSGAGEAKAGLYLTRDEAGALEITEALLDYAYAFRIDRGHYLSFGVSGGWLDNRVDFQKVNWKTPPPYGLIDEGFFNMSAGVFYNISSPDSHIARSAESLDGVPRFYGGVSSLQVLSLGGSGASKRVQHYYGLLGCVWSGVEPSVWIRYVPNVEYNTLFSSPVSFDANLRYIFDSHFWLGGGAHSNATLSLELGGRILISNSNAYSSNASKFMQWSLSAGGFPAAKSALARAFSFEFSAGFVL